MSQEEIFKLRQKFIDERQNALLKTASQLEQSLLRELYTQLIQDLKINKGIIADNKGNLKWSTAVDKIFNSFEKNQQVKIAGQIAADFGKIFSFNNQYYELFQVPRKRFDDIKRKVRDTMRTRIGLTDTGKVAPNGYLDQFIKDTRLREAIKQMTYKAVTGQQTLSDFTEGLQLLVIGKDGTPNKKVEGSLTKYYKAFAYDTYAQFDRSTNKEFALALNLRVIRYSGGLIEDSREFCVKKNDKLFTIEETEQWKNDPTLPMSKAERDSGTLAGYNPIIDMGRWNCRHLGRFVSKERALRERPELKSYFENLEKPSVIVEKEKAKTDEGDSSVLVAPFYDTTISNTKDASALRQSPAYIAQQKMIIDVAEKMGIKISSIDETIGGFVNEDKKKIIEISNKINIQTGDLDKAEQFAAILGALSNDTQQATIAGKYIQIGSKNQTAFETEIKVNNLDGALKALKKIGIDDFTVDESTETISLLDFSNGTDLEFSKKIHTFADELDNNNIKYGEANQRAIESRWVDAKRRSELFEAFRREADQRQGGQDLRDLYKQAEERNQEFINIKPVIATTKDQAIVNQRKWIEGLSDEQKSAFENYTKTHYTSINNNLRFGSEIKDKFTATANELNNTLRSAPKYHGKVYRGIRFDDEQKITSFIDNLKAGDLYFDKGFMSSSLNIGVVKDWIGQMGIRFEINSKSGVLISDMSNQKNEQEVLFNLNSKFKIISIKKESDLFVIEMSEI